MPAIRLDTKRVEKPWGRKTLWPGFDPVPEGGDPIGEVWFQVPGGGDPVLLVKYLFTSAKLSVQVHPDDVSARASGHERGKDEAWVVLAADPHATIAIGTKAVMTREALRASAEDGTIESKLVWHPVHAGDSYYSAAGTVHAIGAGLTLIEIQQNVDLTYRLYDYGSDRELHLDAGIAVADPVPYVANYKPNEVSPGRTILADGPKLVMERWSQTGRGTLSGGGRTLWLVPLAGEGRIDGETLAAGGVWMVDGPVELELGEGSDLVVAYPDQGVIDAIWK